MLINGEVASEFTLNALCAARYGVPSTFLSGIRECVAKRMNSCLVFARSPPAKDMAPQPPLCHRRLPLKQFATALSGRYRATCPNAFQNSQTRSSSLWNTQTQSKPIEAVGIRGSNIRPPHTLLFRANDFFSIFSVQFDLSSDYAEILQLCLSWALMRRFIEVRVEIVTSVAHGLDCKEVWYSQSSAIIRSIRTNREGERHSDCHIV